MFYLGFGLIFFVERRSGWCIHVDLPLQQYTDDR